MPAPHGHEPTDQTFLVRMTSSERERLNRLAEQNRTSVNQSVRILIQASGQEPDPLAELDLAPHYRAYVESHAHEFGITTSQAIADMIDHCIQHDRYDRVMAERQKAAEAASRPPAPPSAAERPKHPGGTRKQRERARAAAERTNIPPALPEEPQAPNRRPQVKRRPTGVFPTTIPAGFRAPDPDQ